MGAFLELLKEFKDGFKRGCNKNVGFPVDLNGSLQKFMSDIREGDCYVALDTGILVSPNYNFFAEENKFTRFVISQNTIYLLENTIKENNENAPLAKPALQRIQNAVDQGFKISFIEATKEDINQLGLEISVPTSVLCSIYKAALEVNRIHQNDCRRLFFVTLQTWQDSVAIANSLGIPTYIIKK